MINWAKLSANAIFVLLYIAIIDVYGLPRMYLSTRQ